MKTLPQKPKRNRAPDMTGRRFGRLVVIRRGVDKVYPRSVMAVWEVKCDCGTIKQVSGNCLRKGESQSCGCLHRDMSTKHGFSAAPGYGLWQKMVSRCTDPASNGWEYYGGRGITVCDKWLNSPEAFWADMGARPKGLSLERIDNDKCYSPENCRWATRKDQARNRRSNKFFEYLGAMRCISEIAEITGVKPMNLRHWLVARGMSVDDAIAKSNK